MCSAAAFNAVVIVLAIIFGRNADENGVSIGSQLVVNS